jgi:predicted Rdx family selenoprotein
VSPGGRGQFDVVADGTAVFSKERAGRFPRPGEALALVAPG